jgi:hypothetical protein
LKDKEYSKDTNAISYHPEHEERHDNLHFGSSGDFPKFL